MKRDADYGDLTEAIAILGDARDVALGIVLREVHSYGQVYTALETYRWVSNACDHVARAQRESLGLERRDDPCLPSW